MIAIGIARRINLKSGGVVVTPWEIDELDDDWIDAFLSEIPDQIEAHNSRIANIRREFFAKHRVTN